MSVIAKIQKGRDLVIHHDQKTKIENVGFTMVWLFTMIHHDLVIHNIFSETGPNTWSEPGRALVP
jgi:hypothetical protein